MFKIAGTLAILLTSPASATPVTTIGSPATTPAKICKHVVSAERGAKPYQMCMTKAEWAAKAAADAKDANRIVCRYEEVPGTRFRGRKICMSAAEWANQRFEERQAIERIQNSTCKAGSGC